MRLNRTLLLLFIAVFTFSCDDSSNGMEPDTAQVSIWLTDQPAVYESIWVDIEEVSLQMVDSGWINLPGVAAGVYDLLELQNGIDTLLGSIQVPAGRLNQIRLKLGNNNQVEFIDGVVQDLEVSSGATSGLKLNVNDELSAGVNYAFTLDFDAGRSIVAEGNGQLRLKPVIRVFSDAESGAVAGYFDPVGSALYVWTTTAAGDTVGSIPDSTGYFLLGGLPSGAYDIDIEPQVGFSDTTVTGVNVTEGSTTLIDTLAL